MLISLIVEENPIYVTLLSFTEYVRSMNMVDCQNTKNIQYIQSIQNITDNKYNMAMTEKAFTNYMQGWECPKCGRVYSPYTHMCPYCGPKHSHETVTTDLPYVPLEQQKSPQMICS